MFELTTAFISGYQLNLKYLPRNESTAALFFLQPLFREIELTINSSYKNSTGSLKIWKIYQDQCRNRMTTFNGVNFKFTIFDKNDLPTEGLNSFLIMLAYLILPSYESSQFSHPLELINFFYNEKILKGDVYPQSHFIKKLIHKIENSRRLRYTKRSCR